MIDYRSDTVTKPTPAMLDAMMQAPVGDDVFGEDTATNALEQYAANLFGMEAAIFCPSGTMTNQIAIKLHTQPGDEVICDHLSHVYQYEGGGIASNSLCSVKLLQGNRGRITADQVVEAINPYDVHKPISKLVSLENTTNRGGGACYSLEALQQIKAVCQQHNLQLHLDGARLFNALIAENQSPENFGTIFNTISICLSKGLGAPVGSLLLGTKTYIQKARRIRKVWGGGMRQCGYLTAAGLFALENNIERLATDHHHAKLLAEAWQQKSFVGEVLPVDTNILIFEVANTYNPVSLRDLLLEKGVAVYAISPTQIRMVTHLNISPEMIEKTIDIIHKL